ncbi:MAG: hypothetical protein ABSC37_06075 [Xanthobacteraceae bacterium]
MRILVAALAIALMMASAHAQGVGGQGMGGGFGGGRKQQHAKTPKTETAKPKVDDKAYNAALKGLPDKQFDPWHGVR